MAPVSEGLHLDTHVVAWLFAGDVARFGAGTKRLLQDHELHVSPVVVLELQYLHEIGRTAEPARTVIDDLAARIGLRVADASLAHVVAGAEQQSWTRDPFDRLIVGHAMLENAPLLTKDRTIRRHYPRARWT
jgi:PIN domain nuclease of toxin-antitoxin system